MSVSLKSMSIDARLFIVSEVLFGIGVGLFSFVLNLHLLSKGISEEQIGRITMVSMLVAGIIAILGGLLASKFDGRKYLLRELP